MLRAAVIATIALAAFAAPATAGAWLRESGEGFVSASTTARTTPVGREAETGLYAEYGAGPRLTLGVDINERAAGAAGHALFFVRVPIETASPSMRLAVELALGGHHVGRYLDGMAKFTVSLGRAFSGRLGSGWANLDAAAELRGGLGPAFFKLDATFGLSSGPRLRPIVRLESVARPGMGTALALTSAVMIEGRGGRTWVLGLERKFSPARSIGIRLELWQKF